MEEFKPVETSQVSSNEDLAAILKNQGRPRNFNVETYCDIIEQMVDSDEIKRALWLCDNAPAYYRDYPTERLVNMKRDILSRCVIVDEYVYSDCENFDVATKWEKEKAGLDSLEDKIDSGFASPRGPIVLQMVKKFNEAGIEPTIIELGPADFWLAYGLRKHGVKFKYHGHTINHKAAETHIFRLTDVWLGIEQAKQSKPEHTIFCCFEVMEHLWDEWTIRQTYDRLGIDACHVALSTPKHSLLGGNTIPWRERTIEHLNAYTPTEFNRIATSMFPGYNFLWYDGFMQVLQGSKHTTSEGL